MVWGLYLKFIFHLGVGVATIHSENEVMLAKKIGIRSLPTMVLLVEGKTAIYREPMISAHKIVGE